MRVAMVFFSLNVPGGSASVFLSLANQLQKAGHDVDVYCHYFDPKRCFPELCKGLRIYSIKQIKSESRINNESIFNRFLLGIDYYINSSKIFSIMQDGYDVIYSSEASAYIPALLYKKKYKVPVVWSVFDPLSLVDRERPGMLINKHRWFEYILKVHNYFDSKKIKQIDAVLVPTEKMKKQLDEFYGIHTIVFPLAGIRVEDFSKDRKSVAEKRLLHKLSFKKNGHTLLLSSGHFLPHRRYEDAIIAVSNIIKRNQNVRLLISGSKAFDPSYYMMLEKLIKKLKLKRYIYLDDDFRTNDEVIGYYQLCDIFVFVSTEQTWGLAPFEAMVCKKPVIISRGVGSHQVLTNNVHALIVPEKSPENIAQSIEELLNNKKLYNNLKNEGYEFAITNFSYEKIAKSLTGLFNTLLI
jgi:glycosyltransferase involved in cell wall biosynthesis